ncbi:hypothetical protein HY68_01690 [Streptomyces sp. AcH 505]|nr:hypothetical protein HY68_01690 [Streptomyces sp. AcH 505]
MATLAASGAKAAWAGVVSGAKSAATAMKAAGLASLDLAKKMAISTGAAIKSSVAWAVERVRMIATAVAEKATAAAQWLLNVAMDANPIMLVVLGLAALVAGAIWAYGHIKWFHDMVNAAFHGIGTAVGWLVDWVKQHWPLLLMILTGPIGLAVGFIVTHWKMISNGFTSAYHSVLNAGKSLLGWVRALPGRIRSGLGKLGSLLVTAGRDLVNGLIHGVQQKAGAAVSAVRGIGSRAVGAFKGVLGISSPSKVFRSLGIYVNQGLVDGLTGSTAKVKTATKRIETLMIQTRNRISDLSTSGRTKSGRATNSWVKSHLKTIAHLEAYAKREDKALKSLAAKRDSVATKLKAAQTKLAAVQKQWTDEKTSIASGIMQGTSVVTTAADDSRALNSNDVVKNMADQVAKAKAFAAQLDQLRKKGLSSDLIAQIAGAGVESGGATALALSSASAAQIKQVNSMQTSLKSAANKTGTAVADSMYGAGVKSAQGLVKGLQSQEKAINKQMAKIAKQMAATIKKALKIKSPSQVFSDIGQYIPQGLGAGIAAAAHHATKAARVLASSVTAAGAVSGQGLITGAANGALPGLASGGMRAPVIHQHFSPTITVQGSVVTEKKLVDVVQKGMLQQGMRNPTTYPAYKR